MCIFGGVDTQCINRWLLGTLSDVRIRLGILLPSLTKKGRIIVKINGDGIILLEDPVFGQYSLFICQGKIDKRLKIDV